MPWGFEQPEVGPALHVQGPEVVIICILRASGIDLNDIQSSPCNCIEADRKGHLGLSYLELSGGGLAGITR